MKSLRLLVLSLSIATPASAVELEPLDIVPISAQVRVALSGEPGELNSSAGVGSASVSGPIANGQGFTGEADVALTVEEDRVSVTFSGSTSQNVGTPTQRTLVLSATVTVDFQVPPVGGPVTPIYTDFTNVVTQDSGWMVGSRYASGSGSGVAGFESLGVLGKGIDPQGTGFNALAFLDDSRDITHQNLLPAGDGVRLAFQIYWTKTIDVGTTGSFSDSFELRFRTVGPVVDSGDVNGDGLVNVLDTTILRRWLAGLPVDLGS